VNVRDAVDEFRGVVAVFALAPRRKYMVMELTCVVPQPVVGIEESFNKAPPAFDRVRMSYNKHIKATDHMAHGSVRVSVRVQVPTHLPEVTDDCGGGFGPITKSYQHSTPINA
jgi:hypothetical protein